MTLGEGFHAATGCAAVDAAYERDENDEFVKPTCVSSRTVSDGDSMIMFNFRPDRAREITRTFADPDFDGFDRKKKPQDINYVCMDRVILHCDMNGFFASVELLSHPELKDKPMAVSGDPESRHGIILAKNEIAKRYGIVTAETIWQAKKKCPELQLVRPHHDAYKEYSHKINQIYQQYTDMARRTRSERP